MSGFSARTHANTHTDAACVITAGRWVEGRHCMEYSKATAAKTSARKEKKNTHYLKLCKLSVCVCVCVSAGPVWHSMWMTIWHHGPVIKEALDLPTSCHHGRRWVVTPQEAGAASATANSGNMFEPSVVYLLSLSLRRSLLQQPTRLGATTLVLPSLFPLSALSV